MCSVHLSAVLVRGEPDREWKEMTRDGVPARWLAQLLRAGREHNKGQDQVLESNRFGQRPTTNDQRRGSPTCSPTPTSSHQSAAILVHAVARLSRWFIDHRTPSAGY